MAEKKADQKADQPSDEAVAATSQQYTGTSDPEDRSMRRLVEQNRGQVARNPVDFASETGEVNVDDLPPVPPAGMFMDAEEATEEVTAPLTAADEGDQKRADEGDQKKASTSGKG